MSKTRAGGLHFGIQRPAAHSAQSIAIESLELRCLFSGGPTAFEQYQLELINWARAHPAAEATKLHINLNEGLKAGTISTAAKQPLAFNPDLIASAEGYTQTLLGTVNYFDHFYDGTTPSGRMEAAGYVFSGSYAEGENIGVDAHSNAFPVTASVTAGEFNALFVDSGVSGRGHRLNLMDPNYKEIGIGIAAGSPYYGLSSSKSGTAWNAVITTEDFAASDADSKPFLTGVVFNDKKNSHFYAPGEGLGGITITATDGSHTYTTTTWNAGGYSLEVPSGAYTVTASGSGLKKPITHAKVVVKSLNVEVDFTK